MRWLVILLVVASCSRDDRRPPAPSSTTQHRLVTLSPSATEVVAALGATAQLVGVDQYSTFPTEVTKLTKVGSFLAPNIEVIVSLRPTLVILDDVHGATGTVLGDAGVPSVACPMHGLPDVKRGLRSVGDKIGRAAEAERWIAQIDAALDAASAKRPGRRPRVLAVIDRQVNGLGNLVGAGPGSWIDELLAVVGAQNVLAASSVKYPKISLEEVLRAQPEIILDLSYAAREEISAWQAADVPASKTGRVRALSEPYLVAPSPRVTEALDLLARSISIP
ncbi:MAG: helical backbone metal receptor [Kofleriaceae bacterium]